MRVPPVRESHTVAVALMKGAPFGWMMSPSPPPPKRYRAMSGSRKDDAVQAYPRGSHRGGHVYVQVAVRGDGDLRDAGRVAGSGDGDGAHAVIAGLNGAELHGGRQLPKLGGAGDIAAVDLCDVSP